MSVSEEGPCSLELVCIHSLVFRLEGRAWQEPEPSHGSGTLHPGQVHGGSLPLFSPDMYVYIFN